MPPQVAFPRGKGLPSRRQVAALIPGRRDEAGEHGWPVSVLGRCLVLGGSCSAGSTLLGGLFLLLGDGLHVLLLKELRPAEDGLSCSAQSPARALYSW